MPKTGTHENDAAMEFVANEIRGSSLVDRDYTIAEMMEFYIQSMRPTLPIIPSPRPSYKIVYGCDD